MSSMCSHRSYLVIRAIVKVVLRILHPVIRIEGRENVPQGAAVICANHSGILDPAYVIIFAHLQKLPRTMAKKELFSNRLFGWFLSKLGAFPVDRENADISAIKNALQTLKNDRALMIFPEGTRIRKGKKAEPHSGAALIASRMNAPIVPVYLCPKRFLFSPIVLKYGKPYHLSFEGDKPTAQELQQKSVELMQRIYEMGE